MLSSQLKKLEAEKDKITGSLQKSQEQLAQCKEKLAQATDPAALEYLQAQVTYCTTSVACDQKKLNKISTSISQTNAPKQEEEKSEEQNIKDIAQEKMDAIEEGERKFQGKLMKIREKIYKIKSAPDKSVDFINREMVKLQAQFDEVNAMMTAWVEEQMQKVEEWMQEKVIDVVNKQIEKTQQKIELEKKSLEDQMKQAIAIKTGIKL